MSEEEIAERFPKIVEFSELGEFLDPRDNSRLIPAKIAGHQRDIASRSEMWEQPSVLDDVPDPEPDVANCLGRDWDSVKSDRTRAGLDKTD